MGIFFVFLICTTSITGYCSGGEIFGNLAKTDQYIKLIVVSTLIENMNKFLANASYQKSWKSDKKLISEISDDY